MLFQITGISVFADTIQLGLELLQVSDRIRGEPLEIEFGEDPILLLGRHRLGLSVQLIHFDLK